MNQYSICYLFNLVNLLFDTVGKNLVNYKGRVSRILRIPNTSCNNTNKHFERRQF